MKRFTLLIGLVLVFGFSTYAQTKRIAHRSHSGNHSNYVTLEKTDNLGGPPISYELMNKLYLVDSFTYLRIDSINAIRILDSLKKVQMMDSLKKLHSEKKQIDTQQPKQLKPLKKTDTLKIQELKKKENHKKQSFPFPLLLLIVIPTLAIAFATKHLKK